MSVSQLIADLVAAGVSGELVGRVAAAIVDASAFRPVDIPEKSGGSPVDIVAERRRAFDRERKRMARSGGSPVDTADIPPPLVASPKKETPPRPPKEKTTPPPEPLPVDSGTPPARSVFDVLRDVLDEKRAWAVIEHRKAMGARGRMTLHAAELLAGKFSKLPDPNVGADAMISNGWLGFEVDWMESRRGDRRGPAPPRERPMTNIERMKAELAEEIAENEREERQGGPQGAGAENGRGVPGVAVAANGRSGR